MTNPETTGPYRIIDSKSRGNRFMVVDDRGEAELGTWFIASTWWRSDAERIARLLNEIAQRDTADEGTRIVQELNP